MKNVAMKPPFKQRLKMLVRKATAAARPLKISTVDRSSVSVTLYQLPNAPFHNAWYAATGSLPVR